MEFLELLPAVYYDVATLLLYVTSIIYLLLIGEIEQTVSHVFKCLAPGRLIRASFVLGI